MIRRALPRVAGGALVALLASASAAWAAPAANIVSVTTQGTDLRVVVEVSDVPADQTVDPASATLSLNGTPVDATTKQVDENSSIQQVTMLVLDTSGSMAGDKIAAAKDAATGFLDAVPAGVQVGLITFGNVVDLRVRATTDHESVARAIAGLSAETPGQTKLYDAVQLAATKLDGTEVGTAVVLSDGADRGSTATLDQATSSAKKSGATFDAVAFVEPGKSVASLDTITAATGGSVTNANDATQLAAAFDRAAASIANRYVIVGTVPAGLSGTTANVAVSLDVGGTTITDSAVVPLKPVTLKPGDFSPTPIPPASALANAANRLIWPALLAIFAALAVVVYVAISATRREGMGTARMKRSLSVYTMGGDRGPTVEQETTVLGDTQVARSAVEFAGRVVARRDLESVVGSRLEAAGVPLKSAEWMLIHVGVMVASGFFFLFLFGMKPLPMILGLVLGFIGPGMYLTIKEGKRTKAFMANLPDTLQLIAGSLSAGYSMPQAIDTVVREGRPPISSEFNRALVETRLGVPLEDALDGVAIRMKSQDFAWVVMAIKIQREVGGNLAEVLTTVANTLRERERLRRQVQVLSAEGRLSAWILGLLPVLFAVYLVLVRPTYLQPMVTSVLGWLMIGTAVFLMIVGAFWLRKVVKVEV